MKTKVDIISGFLGAGKTMLIKKLIKENFIKENIVIIENEFGEVGIDGSILAKSKINIKEINSGCICCSVSGNFVQAIKEMCIKYNPERIIIEPSGVGKLSEILSVINQPEVKNIVTLNTVITVVDVSRFHMYIKNFSEFYKNQITNGKTIVLSRSQNLSKEELADIMEKINKLNREAIIISTPWDEIKGDKIINAAEKEKIDLELEKVNLNKGRFKLGNNHSASEVFQTFGMETPKIYNKEKLASILRELKDEEKYGKVLRAKGILQENKVEWVQFDYVPNEIQIQKIEADYTGRLCVIGSNLNKENLKKLFL